MQIYASNLSSDIYVYFDVKFVIVIAIQEVLISKEVFDQKFICDLSKCKGACCREGDYGAPLEANEIAAIKETYPKFKQHLKDEARVKIEKEGFSSYYKEPGFDGTPLLDDGSCVYLHEDALGFLSCGIEKEYNAGNIPFKKPISCHLYPIRVSENEKTGFKAMNYDRWDICAAACKLGQKNKVPVFQFLKEAISRKFGTPFYEEMEAMFQYLKGNTTQ